MEKKIQITALLFGIVAIILGAFGAHALKKIFSIEQLTSFETGVRYLIYHAFFLFFLAYDKTLIVKQKAIIYYLNLIGVLFFSGSIFLLTSTKSLELDLKFLGPITPIGGFLLILSWVFMLYFLIIKKS
jgi:uncharacterized membrane protein YgdD (TMEM256/DUF423 family)